eukprot:314723-Prorocentrum_minimum.AAC.1
MSSPTHPRVGGLDHHVHGGPPRARGLAQLGGGGGGRILVRVHSEHHPGGHGDRALHTIPPPGTLLRAHTVPPPGTPLKCIPSNPGHAPQSSGVADEYREPCIIVTSPLQSPFTPTTKSPLRPLHAPFTPPSRPPTYRHPPLLSPLSPTKGGVKRRGGAGMGRTLRRHWAERCFNMGRVRTFTPGVGRKLPYAK